MSNKKHTPFGVAFRRYLVSRRPWLTGKTNAEPAGFRYARYESLLASAFSRHLARGGSVVEHDTSGVFARFAIGDNCFADPHKSDAAYLGLHCARRFIGFGFAVSLV